MKTIICSPDVYASIPLYLRSPLIVCNAMLEPGTMLQHWLPDPEFVRITSFFESDYDDSLVPLGEKPRILLSYDVDVSWDFRYQTNNWLIKRFGTYRKTVIPMNFELSNQRSLLAAGVL